MSSRETANELIGRDLYPVLQRIADRYRIWTTHIDIIRKEIKKRPRCSCELFTMHVQHAITDPQLHLVQRQEAADHYEITLALAAQIAGWETLRGGYGRRELIESIFGIEVPRGRPRKVFLTQGDLGWAEFLVEHVREEGADHLRHVLNDGIVYLPRDFTTGTVFSIQPVLKLPRVRQALETLTQVGGLTPPEFKKSHRRIAARVLAAIAECSEDTVRRGLPKRVEKDVQLDGLRRIWELAFFGDTVKKSGTDRDFHALRAGVARITAETLDAYVAQRGLSGRGELIDRLERAGTTGWSKRELE